MRPAASTSPYNQLQEDPTVPAPSAPVWQGSAEELWQRLNVDPTQKYGMYPTLGQLPPPVAPQYAMAVPPPPTVPGAAAAPVAPRANQQFDLSYYRRGVNEAQNYISPENKRRAKTASNAVASFVSNWGELASMVIGMYFAWKGQEAETLSAKDHALHNISIGMMACAGFFLLRKINGAYSTLSSSHKLRDHALHSPELVNTVDQHGNRDKTVIAHNNSHTTRARVAHAINIGSAALISYAAHQLAENDPHHAHDNLALLGGGMVLEIISGIVEMYSERSRARSIHPAESHDIAIKGKGLALVAFSVSAFIASASLAVTNEHNSYAKVLTSALIGMFGLGLLTTLAKHTGHELTAKAVVDKVNTLDGLQGQGLDPKVNDSVVHLGLCKVGMKESTRHRIEEVLIKGMLFSAQFTAKRFHGVPAIASIFSHVLAIAVGSILISKSRDARAVSLHNRVDLTLQGHQVSKHNLETGCSMSLGCC
ncbi:MAG: hypothetical protein P1U63_10920 [Coxiellaceae bacterium]|nr:hypothetical protein [Coxiellaceae bacterium]